MLAVGPLSDRFGRKASILPAATIILLGILVFVYGDSYTLLIVSAVLLGVGEGLAGPSPVAYVADIAPRGLAGC